jgi:hypothetical protein
VVVMVMVMVMVIVMAMACEKVMRGKIADVCGT